MTLEGRHRWLAVRPLPRRPVDRARHLDRERRPAVDPRGSRLLRGLLAWVINCRSTFGGFMLLAGRLGDLYGHRRVFLLGVGLFTLASLACGLATSQEMLVGARAIQGIGGAVVAAVALSR